jgi:hypothetical protein
MPQPKKQRLSLSFLFATYGERVLEQLAKDKTCGQVFSPEIAEKIRQAKNGDATQAEYMAEVVTPVMEAFLDKSCPSAKGKAQIAQWVIRQYLAHRHNGNPILAEDLYKIGDNLKYFDSLKNSAAFKEGGDNPDLLSYKTYAAFEEIHLQRKARKEAAGEAFNIKPEAKAAILSETTFLYDGPEGRVVVPHTPGASKYWGSNTKWCIAGKEYAEQYFPRYNAKSPVIFILPKGLHDDKIALVDHTLYNSADATIPSLPEPHQGLMDKCAENLSPQTRKSLTQWLPKEEEPEPELVQVAAKELYCLGESRRPRSSRIRHGSRKGRRKLNPYRDYKPSPKLWSDKEFVLAAMARSSWALHYADDRFKEDLDIVLAAVSSFGGAFRFAPDQFRNNREAVLAVVSKGGMALEYAAEEFKEDREIVLAAVTRDGRALQHAADQFKNDPEIVLAAVSHKVDTDWYYPNMGFKHASDELKDDFDVVSTAVAHNGKACLYASDRLRDDPRILIPAVSEDIELFSRLDPEMKKDKDFISQLLKASEDLPFEIRKQGEEAWQPGDRDLSLYQLQALERMAQNGRIEKLSAYARRMECMWGNPDLVFAGNPTALFAKFRQGMTAPAKRAAPSPGNRQP